MRHRPRRSSSRDRAAGSRHPCCRLASRSSAGCHRQDRERLRPHRRRAARRSSPRCHWQLRWRAASARIDSPALPEHPRRAATSRLRRHPRARPSEARECRPAPECWRRLSVRSACGSPPRRDAWPHQPGAYRCRRPGPARPWKSTTDPPARLDGPAHLSHSRTRHPYDSIRQSIRPGFQQIFG